MRKSGLFHGLAMLDSHSRFGIAVLAGLGAFLGFFPAGGTLERAVSGWLALSGSFLLLSFHTFSRAEIHHIRKIAARQDPGRQIIFGMVIGGACASLLAIGFLVGGGGPVPAPVKALHAALAGVTVLFSWLLIHTVFAFRYAHLFYDGDQHGLEFPGDTEPDYRDFAYFSFVIGMTCQVSDVTISSRGLRVLALAHGVLSFVFNTVILAMTISIVAGML